MTGLAAAIGGRTDVRDWTAAACGDFCGLIFRSSPGANHGAELVRGMHGLAEQHSPLGRAVHGRTGFARDGSGPSVESCWTTSYRPVKATSAASSGRTLNNVMRTGRTLDAQGQSASEDHRITTERRRGRSSRGLVSVAFIIATHGGKRPEPDYGEGQARYEVSSGAPSEYSSSISSFKSVVPRVIRLSRAVVSTQDAGFSLLEYTVTNLDSREMTTTV